ncbi:phosphatase and tensin protein [Pelomyxa schiedti]|nr:phosphatase and tensin protein [Pelomyxa schiedti]
MIRAAVSGERIRYIADGFDLDLAYITTRIIAMATPGITASQKVYRNPLPAVQRFFNQRHKGKYMIYNLCSEEYCQYEPTVFDYQITQIPFQDHHAPPINLISQFCHSVDSWLGTDPKNVIAVHCKGGKGRTGLMICCYLVHKGMTAEESLKEFGKQRGKNVTGPSQIRYIHYFEQVTRREVEPLPIQLPLLLARIHLIGENRLEPQLTANFENTEIHLNSSMNVHSNYIDINCGGSILKGDVEFNIFDKRESIAMFTIHTAFVDPKVPLFLPASEIDKCRSEVEGKITTVGCIKSVELCFAQAIPDPSLLWENRTDRFRAVEVLQIPTKTVVHSCAPNGTLTASWFLKNGGKTWVEGCKVMLLRGPETGSYPPVILPPLGQGQVILATTTVIAPYKSGEYVTSWSCSDPSGALFGDILSFSFTVLLSSSESDNTTTTDIRASPTTPHAIVALSSTSPSTKIAATPEEDKARTSRRAQFGEAIRNPQQLLDDVFKMNLENQRLVQELEQLQSDCDAITAENLLLRTRLEQHQASSENTDPQTNH